MHSTQSKNKHTTQNTSKTPKQIQRIFLMIRRISLKIIKNQKTNHKGTIQKEPQQFMKGKNQSKIRRNNN